jgi:hypothetical protein
MFQEVPAVGDTEHVKRSEWASSCRQVSGSGFVCDRFVVWDDFSGALKVTV